MAPRLATPVGGGASQLRRRYARPLYQFTLNETQSTRAEATALLGFLTFVQGDIPFFWSGGEWGTQNTPLLVGYGDGVRQQFLLPNRYITGNLEVQVNGVAIPTPGLDGATGLLSLPTIAWGALITATYTCTYRVTLWQEGETLATEENIALGLFRRQGIVFREFPF